MPRRQDDTVQTHPFGRFIHVLRASNVWNGTDIAPAVVTRVWGDYINVTAFPDQSQPVSYASVLVKANLKDAEQHIAEQVRSGHMGAVVAFWPERT